MNQQTSCHDWKPFPTTNRDTVTAKDHPSGILCATPISGPITSLLPTDLSTPALAFHPFKNVDVEVNAFCADLTRRKIFMYDGAPANHSVSPGECYKWVDVDN